MPLASLWLLGLLLGMRQAMGAVQSAADASLASTRALASSLAGTATSCAGIDLIYLVGTADSVPLG